MKINFERGNIIKILIDSRETKKLSFSHPWITETIVTKLDTADYQALYENNMVSRYVIERKGSLSDLFSTLTSNYSRFKREIQRAKDKELIMILAIETNFSNVLKGCKHSSVKGQTIIRKMFTLWMKYGIYFMFCKNAEEMSKFIIELFLYAGKHKLWYPSGGQSSPCPNPPFSEPVGRSGENAKNFGKG